MMNFVGVDGCKAGWFAVSVNENNEWKTHVFADIFKLWDYFWAQYGTNLNIYIDIPIGLRESTTKERLCDKEARVILGKPRNNSVFPAPCRQATKEKTYENASYVNEKFTGRRLSKQAWGIVPKIRQVDILMCTDENARSHITEIHPELCFYGLVKHPMENRKGDNEGFKERYKHLLNIYPPTDKIVDNSLSNYYRKDVKEDDILDSLAAAVTARYGHESKLRTIPEKPEFDPQGLPMRMVFLK